MDVKTLLVEDELFTWTKMYLPKELTAIEIDLNFEIVFFFIYFQITLKILNQK